MENPFVGRKPIRQKVRVLTFKQNAQKECFHAYPLLKINTLCLLSFGLGKHAFLGQCLHLFEGNLGNTGAFQGTYVTYLPFFGTGLAIIPCFFAGTCSRVSQKQKPSFSSRMTICSFKTRQQLKPLSQLFSDPGQKGNPFWGRPFLVGRPPPPQKKKGKRGPLNN